jgi:hypothetical protein
MLLTPFASAAILLREVSWTEAAALIAIVCAFAIKDPLVVLVRQRLVWKQKHPETRMAGRWFAVELLAMAACGAVLAGALPWRPLALLAAGATGFALMAVWVNVGNRQRSEWFQVASAAALSSTSLVACVAVLGTVPRWGWLLWLLCGLQSAAGIFVVHARLDARAALREAGTVHTASRRAAQLSVGVLLVAAIAFWQKPEIAAALATVAAGYCWDLRRQRTAEGVKLPLQRVGQQLLALSILYAVMIVAGLW